MLWVCPLYWAWFDEPQFECGWRWPYSGGGIWESVLNLLTEESKLSGRSMSALSKSYANYPALS